ncbi:MAG: elongation factor P, partial [Thermodesulfobacteriota bacterium]
PITVELEVIETEPGYKGDTVSSGNKPAKLETGAMISVPLFIEVGDMVKVDTRSGDYLERIKKR